MISFAINGLELVISAGRVNQPRKINEVLGKVREGIVQVLDAKSVAGLLHVLHAVKLAVHSWKKGERFAREDSLDLLCWIAAERQIEIAIRKVGIKPETQEVVVIALGRPGESERLMREVIELLGLREESKLLETSEDKLEHLRQLYSIPAWLKGGEVEKMILEKIAMLELKK